MMRYEEGLKQHEEPAQVTKMKGLLRKHLKSDAPFDEVLESIFDCIGAAMACAMEGSPKSEGITMDMLSLTMVLKNGNKIKVHISESLNKSPEKLKDRLGDLSTQVFQSMVATSQIPLAGEFQHWERPETPGGLYVMATPDMIVATPDKSATWEAFRKLYQGTAQYEAQEQQPTVRPGEKLS